MDLRRLRYLEEVIAAGGFRRAARALGISQPALTLHIRQLEHDLGVLLVDRTSHPVLPTPAGEVVIAHAREVSNVVTRMHAEVARIAEQQTGRLRLGTNQWAEPLLPSLMATFSSRYPNVHVLLRGVSHEAPNLIVRGELDVCLLALHPGEGELSPQLQSTRLFSFQHVFSVHPSHRLANRSLVRLDELAEERFVHSTGSAGVTLKRALSEAGIVPHVVLETNDVEMVTSLVAQGMGIGFTPEFMVKRAQPQLRTFSVSEVSLHSNAMLAWAGHLRAAPALQAFVGFVMSQRWDMTGLPTDQSNVLT
jgi:DNA-binding transcriptional LysR family regulator